MEAYNIYKNLAWLNSLPENEATEVFLSISGSELWARELAKMRPFPMIERLYQAADAVWFSLPSSERVAAFGRSAESQGTNNGPPDKGAETELAKAANLYRNKFGFIFVLDGEGKSEAEKAAVCRARLGNSVATELQIAAEEHRKLIELRLNRVLEK